MYGCKNCVHHNCEKENGRTVHKCSEYPEVMYFGLLDQEAVIKADCGCFARIKAVKNGKATKA
jgi:hypothetical protein